VMMMTDVCYDVYDDIVRRTDDVRIQNDDDDVVLTDKEFVVLVYVNEMRQGTILVK